MARAASQVASRLNQVVSESSSGQAALRLGRSQCALRQRQRHERPAPRRDASASGHGSHGQFALLLLRVQLQPAVHRHADVEHLQRRLHRQLAAGPRGWRRSAELTAPAIQQSRLRRAASTAYATPVASASEFESREHSGGRVTTNASSQPRGPRTFMTKMDLPSRSNVGRSSRVSASMTSS